MRQCMINLSPEQCSSIEEVRNEIDRIDNSIITFLGERSQYVEKASGFKKDKESVSAPDRVKTMLVQRKKWAFDNGLDPVFIEELFKNITSHFIGKEKNKWLIQNQFSIEDIKITEATRDDLQSILDLQIASYQSEAMINDDFEIAPLLYSMQNMEKEYNDYKIFKAVFQDTIIGSVRGYQKNDISYLGKLIVHPDFQNLGIGRKLMLFFEKYFINCSECELFTGTNSVKNISLYKKMGYEIFKEEKISDKYGFVYMRKKLSV
jgi:chorismate mutase-like protein